MNFIPEASQYYAVVFGENGTMIREIDINIVYLLGFDKFAQMMRTGKMPVPYEKLFAPVEVANAIVSSFGSKKEVKINGLD